MASPSHHDASLRRQRRKSVITGTGAPVPVPDPTVLVPLSPTQTTRTPGGVFQADASVRLFQK